MLAYTKYVSYSWVGMIMPISSLSVRLCSMMCSSERSTRSRAYACSGLVSMSGLRAPMSMIDILRRSREALAHHESMA